MHRHLPAAAAAFAFLSSLALPGNARADAAAADLDTVLVTGTRSQQRLADSLVPAQVIEREEIERSQARDLIELLRGRAGLDVGNTGGRGKLSSLYLRGAESDHVLVLVDGIKMNSATAGMPAIQDLPLAQIERIDLEPSGGGEAGLTDPASPPSFRPITKTRRLDKENAPPRRYSASSGVMRMPSRDDWIPGL